MKGITQQRLINYKAVQCTQNWPIHYSSCSLFLCDAVTQLFTFTRVCIGGESECYFKALVRAWRRCLAVLTVPISLILSDKENVWLSERSRFISPCSCRSSTLQDSVSSRGFRDGTYVSENRVGDPRRGLTGRERCKLLLMLLVRPLWKRNKSLEGVGGPPCGRMRSPPLLWSRLLASGLILVGLNTNFKF